MHFQKLDFFAEEPDILPAKHNLDKSQPLKQKQQQDNCHNRIRQALPKGHLGHLGHTEHELRHTATDPHILQLLIEVPDEEHPHSEHQDWQEGVDGEGDLQFPQAEGAAKHEAEAFENVRELRQPGVEVAVRWAQQYHLE